MNDKSKDWKREANKEMADLGFPDPVPKSVVKPKDHRLSLVLSKFKNIEVWVDSSGRIPCSDNRKSLIERRHAEVLRGVRDKPEQISYILKHSDDRHGLLSISEGCTESREYSSNSDGVDDLRVMAEELEKLGCVSSSSISKLKFVRAANERNRSAAPTRQRHEKIAGRKQCLDFEDFRHVFDSARVDLKNKTFVSMGLPGKADIKVQSIYILGGKLVYISSVDDEFKKGGKKDARLRVIFEDGVESNMLKTSFLKRMAKSPRNRAIVKNTTGILYVLQSESDNPYIDKNRDLIHKIGFTTGRIQNRLSSAHLQTTYLMARVKLKKYYETFLVHPKKFEGIFHKFFERARLRIDVADKDGKMVKAKEWYVVPIEAIDDFVEKFIEHGEGIVNYRYDVETSRVVER